MPSPPDATTGRERAISAARTVRQGIGIGLTFGLCLLASLAPASAQTFFGDLGNGVTVGVDRGSTALLPETDRLERFLTFDTYGADILGPDIASASLAYPGLLTPLDQFDVVAVIAGALEPGPTEVVAGGLGYRFPVGSGGLAAYVNADRAEVVLGGAANLALDIRGHNTNLSVGVRKIWQLSPDATLRATVELRGRNSTGEVLGFPVIDEDLRVLRAGLYYESGVPFGFRKRFAIGVSKGFDAFGASPGNNPAASLPGASTRFLRLALGGEVSLPVSTTLVVNAGIAGQWADTSLPLSERCGYGTNAYSRGFDQSIVNGDRCIAGRIELARYLAIPSPANPTGLLAQGFAGIDGGRVHNLANGVLPASDEGWSSLSVGTRIMYRATVGEIAVSRILDRFDGAAGQDRSRLWIRVAARF